MSALKRYIPLPVRIRLRQESFFGCAECGNPILDYHHIIPWAEKHHNDPAHMVALCPTHHREIGKRQRAYAYELKKQPYNKMHGKFRGTLYTEKEKPSFIMGTNTFIKTPIILSFYDQALIKYRIDQGQSLISVFYPMLTIGLKLKLSTMILSLMVTLFGTSSSLQITFVFERGKESPF